MEFKNIKKIEEILKQKNKKYAKNIINFNINKFNNFFNIYFYRFIFNK